MNNSKEALLEVAFPRLEKLSVENCDSWKYLLSSSAARRLSELNHLELKSCSGTEEIVVVMDKTTIFFPKLQTVELTNLSNLKRISSSNCIIEFPYLVELTISECPELGTSDVGSSLTLIKDEKHQVGEKASVANAQPLTKENKATFPNALKELLRLSDHRTSFRNLQQLTVSHCPTLLHLFPSSAVESLAQLKKLDVWECKAMEVVVTTTKALRESSDQQRLRDNHLILFPKLECLHLVRLPKLKMFCEGDCVDQYCPSLLTLEIEGCESFITFVADTAHTLKETVEQQVGIRDLEVTQQPLFNHIPKVFHMLHNLEEIVLDFLLVEKIIWQRQEEHDHVTHSRLRKLELRLPKLMKLFEETSSSLSFENLTFLEVSECHEMVNLLSASTAKSLVQLKEMIIYDCKKLTQVVIANSEEEAESSSGIVFSQLKKLTLHGLPSLKSFYGGNSQIQFPLLEKVIVSECPEMKIFSNGRTITPKLNKLISKLQFQYSFESPETAKPIEEIWEGNLNVTIRNIWENDINSCRIALERLFS